MHWYCCLQIVGQFVYNMVMHYIWQVHVFVQKSRYQENGLNNIIEDDLFKEANI